MISLRNVGKRYRSITAREVRALEDFSLELRAGEVFGLAGPNGAGKSTLISLLLGFLAPSEGSVRMMEMEPRAFIERHGIGYLSELVNIPPTWRVGEALQRYALLSGIAPADVGARCNDAVALLGLEEHRGKRIRQLSKGNLQRVGLAQALLSDAPVIILDEPTHGLDPVWTQRFRDVVDALRRPDRLILIASHNLDELSRLADRVGIVDRGRLQRVVDVHASERDAADGTPYRIVVSSGEQLVAAVFPGARALSPGEYEVRDMSLQAINAGLGRLIGEGALLNAVYPAHSALEQQFREAVGTAGELQ